MNEFTHTLIYEYIMKTIFINMWKIEEEKIIMYNKMLVSDK